MDPKNVSKPKQKTHKNFRSSRSISSPSEPNKVVLGPQRAQSQLIFSGNVHQSLWQANSMHNFGGNPFLNGVNGFHRPQQIWHPNGQCGNPNWAYLNLLTHPVPSRSGANQQFREKDIFPPGCSPVPTCSAANQPLPPGCEPVPICSGVKQQFHGSDILPPNCDSTTRTNKKVLNRKWEPENTIQNKEKKFVFTLMSYNVLAQDLVENHAYLYKHHNKETLQWQVRWLNILKEIGDADPDIICFQEVQESHIGGYFGLLEKKLGYKSIYKKRTGIRTDGCAIYYKKKRLQLMEYEKVEFLQENVPVLNRDNVAIVARFIPKENHTQAFIVATTHLLYNPKRQDVRLAQVQNLMAEIDKMAFLGTNNNGSSSYLPVVVTGDLNTTPDSAVYEFIIKGILNYENLSRRSLTKDYVREPTGKVLVPEFLQMTDNCQYAPLVHERNQIVKTCTNDRGENIQKECGQSINFSSGTLSHPFSLKSVYNHTFGNDSEGTTYQEKWITVDYIFYSGKKRKGRVDEDKLKLISKYQLPRKSQLKGMHIPDWKHGSDHFSLIVKFSLE